jgi:hypothetical protein
MNERNVAALAALLEEWWCGDGTATEAIARFLASKGVLVPSALTDEDCEREFISIPEDAHEVRAALERIAKGN